MGLSLSFIISALFLIACFKYLPNSSSCCFIPWLCMKRGILSEVTLSVVISSVFLGLCEKLYRVFDFLIDYDHGLWVNESLACRVLYFYTHLPWHKLWYDFPFISVTVVFLVLFLMCIFLIADDPFLEHDIQRIHNYKILMSCFLVSLYH